MLSKAIRIAAEAFEGVTDKSGAPYILHCLTVMRSVEQYGESHMIVGVLHDLIEDTHWTPDMLIKEGFSKDEVVSIMMMTHEDGVEYDTYIVDISSDIMATRCKLGDLRHNSDILRMKGVTEKDLRRVEKYHRAFKFLSDAVKRRA